MPNTKEKSKPTRKKNNSKTTTAKKVTTKVTKKTTTKTTNKTKKVTSTTNKKINTKKIPKKNVSSVLQALEYYDLPNTYNQTVVRILAQTPNTLFVYWDISKEDKNNYMKQYGEYFFNNTKPVLVIHNITKNYDFEIDINDFANSWYLEVSDSNCDYKIELGRRPINKYVSINNDYLFIASSNEMDSPNDHILFNSSSKSIYFRNVKNNQINKKNIATLSFIRNVGKFQYIKDFYKKLYPDEVISSNKLDLTNPSSSNPTSSFL